MASLKKKPLYYFYLLRCSDDTLYSGSTQDIKKRESLHNTGRGSKYVHVHGGGSIVYSEKYTTRSEAMKREIEVKKWPRIKKQLLVTNQNVRKK